VVDYHQQVDVGGIRFTPYAAGHVLGAAMFLIEIAGVRYELLPYNPLTLLANQSLPYNHLTLLANQLLSYNPLRLPKFYNP
jgi:hypothetical protein